MRVESDATGGQGGNGMDGSAAAPGGKAEGSVNVTGQAGVEGDVTAIGGRGGASDSAQGGAGAGASADVIAKGMTATANATAQGGASGATNGGGLTAAAGGLAKATANATATGSGTASASAVVVGGQGGNGGSGAGGGAGASETLTNGASGSTNGGVLNLYPSVTAGNSGYSDTTTVPAGGKAIGTLTLDDTKNTSRSATVNATQYANGGSGGVATNGGNGGTGGAAISNVTVTGSGTVDVSSTANGGAGGVTYRVAVTGDGGSATALADAIGSSANATAQARGGSGVGLGSGTATAEGTGMSGSFAASAQDFPTPQQVALSASTSGGVAGFAEGKAIETVGGALPAADTALQGEAFATASPTKGSVSNVFSANHGIKAAFAGQSTVFGIDQLGGSHSTGGAGSGQSVYSVATEVVLLASLSTRGDLKLGFYGGSAQGSGSVVLDVIFNGVGALQNIHESFASFADAQSFFGDTVLDAGSLANGNGASVEVVLQVNTSTPGSGFFGDVIFGNAAAPQRPGVVHDATHTTVSGHLSAML